MLAIPKQASTMECRGLEKALDQIEAERSAKSGVDAAAMAKAAGIEVCEYTRGVFHASQDG